MAANNNQLWNLIEQITNQLDEVIDQDGDQNEPLNELSLKLKSIITLHEKCNLAEQRMRAKQLTLMRERNLYLEKYRKLEALGEQEGWKDRQGILETVQEIMFAPAGDEEM